MANVSTVTIENFVEGKNPATNLTAKEKSRVSTRLSGVDNKRKGKSYESSVETRQHKYYDMPPRWINQQIALLYGTLNRKASASTQGQDYSHRLVLTKKTSLPKILYQLATRRVRSPAPRSLSPYAGKGDYVWD